MTQELYNPVQLVSIEEAAWILRGNNGKVIAYPTETVYGLGTVIYDEEGIKKIKELKGIPQEKPLSIMISKNRTNDMLIELVGKIAPMAQRLIKFFWPGPLTIIHKAKSYIPDSITGKTGYIGIRCSSLEPISQLIDIIGHPIVSTSANITGHPPALTYEEVLEYFDNKIDGILLKELETSEKGMTTIPSTIVKIDFHQIEIIREGAISKESIYKKLYG